MDEDLLKYLEYEEEQIRLLDLLVLQKISPVFDRKVIEVQRNVEKLETERNGLTHSFTGLDLKRNKLSKLLTERKETFQDLRKRGLEAKKDLEQASLMGPIYQFQMSYSFEQVINSEAQSNNGGHSGDENIPILIKSLSDKKEALEKEVKEKDQIVNNFLKKYL